MYLFMIFVRSVNARFIHLLCMVYRVLVKGEVLFLVHEWFWDESSVGFG